MAGPHEAGFEGR